MFTRDVILEVDNLRLVGRLYLPNKGEPPPYPAVCICHGIPSGKPDPNDRGYPALAERVCQQGLVAFIFNFRGTGASGGNLDILGWARDLKAAVDYLYPLSEVDRSRLSLLGFSGGAAVSIFAAAHDARVSSLVSCACPAEFTFLNRTDNPQPIIDHLRSIGAIRDRDFPGSAEEWFDGFRRVRPVDYISGIAPRPLLLMHGNRDEVVDVSHAHRLYDRAGEPKQLIVVEGAGHRLRQNDEAINIATDWLKSPSYSENN